MRRLSVILTILALVAGLTGPAMAETKVDVSGQVRLRGEIDGKSFDTSSVTGTFDLLRTRVNLKARAAENASAFIQFQDSRTLGANGQSGGLNDTHNVDMHQAYVKIDRFFFDNFGVMAGRFEFTMGNHRVLGNVGWSNVGRSWEGGAAWYTGQKYSLTGFWLKAAERMETAAALGDRDFDVLGALLKLDKANLEVFGLYESDKDTLYDAGSSTVLSGNKLDRATLGFYYHRKHKQYDFEFNGAYQTGNMREDLDISAMMFTGEVGYSFESKKNVRLAAGIDYASGDDDPDDNDYKAYNNLYYTGHKFRGHMDYFVASADYGLMDLMLRGKFDPHPEWTFMGDFHYYKAAADYEDVDGANTTTTSDIGMEFDLALSTSSVAGVQLASGLSFFLPKESFVRLQTGQSHTDAAVWAWGQTIFNF